MSFFGLKQGQDLEKPAAHTLQEFPGLPPLPRGIYLHVFWSLKDKGIDCQCKQLSNRWQILIPDCRRKISTKVIHNYRAKLSRCGEMNWRHIIQIVLFCFQVYHLYKPQRFTWRLSSSISKQWKFRKLFRTYVKHMFFFLCEAQRKLEKKWCLPARGRPAQHYSVKPMVRGLSWIKKKRCTAFLRFSWDFTMKRLINT